MSTATSTAIAKPTPTAAANGKPPALGAVAASLATGFSKIAKIGKPELLKVRQVFVFKKLQARTDTDIGSVVDEGRAEMFAKAMTDGDKFPPIKVMRVMDAPGHKDEEVDVVWDGMHTLRAKEIAKQHEVDAMVWVGTWAQAQFLSATRANREHEKNGKPLSSKDKIHAVKILAQAWKDSGLAKKEWPTNREAADLCGCSRQLVNDMDPFERGKGDVREVKAAKKRAERSDAKTVQGPAADPSKGVKAPPHFDIIQKSTGQKVASYDAANPEEALSTHKGHHKDADMGTFVARKQEAPKEVKSGSERVVGFDFAGMDSHLGYLARGLDGMGDIFSLKETPEYRAALANLNALIGFVNESRKKHGKKPTGNGSAK